MDIKEIKPGRELDALIAEKVMKIDPTQIPSLRLLGSRMLAYSTEIAWAWAVVEKLKVTRYSPDDEPGVEVRLIWSPQLEKWKCCVWNERSIEEDAFTAPHAICLAALRTFTYRE